MKKWYLIDDCLASKGQVFETALDQRARDDFYIGFADVDDDGCVDYDTMTSITSIKVDEIRDF